MKTEFSSYKGDWVRTHQKFCRPGDIVFIDDKELPETGQHFEVVNMPYQVPATLEWSIDLQPIEWKGK
jgi:hypothetical protein